MQMALLNRLDKDNSDNENNAPLQQQSALMDIIYCTHEMPTQFNPSCLCTYLGSYLQLELV